MKYPLHPACAAWPLLPEADLKELTEDIKIHGQIEPITLTPDGQLLDGRCRALACEAVGIEPRTVVYDGDDPVGYVISRNKLRRHLTRAQLILATAKLADLPRGRPTKENISPRDIYSEKRIEKLAEQIEVGKATLNRARAVLKHGAPNIVQMVSDGEVKFFDADAAVRSAPRETQANWTPEDVKREGRKRTKRGKQLTSKPKKINWLNRPPLYLEKGYGMPTDIGTARRPGQPVQLWPVNVQDLMDDQVLVTTAVGNIMAFVSRFQCKVEEFIAATERLLSYEPVRGKTNGEEIDFAAKARKSLALAEAKLNPAMEWLTKLRAFLDGPDTNIWRASR